MLKVNDHLGLLNRLNHFASFYSSIKTIQELAFIVEELLDDLMEIEFSGLYLYDFQENRLKLLVAKGLNEEEKREAELTALERYPGIVFRTKKILNIPDTEHDPEKTILSFPMGKIIRSRLFIPVMNGDQALGAFGILSSSNNHFTDKDVAVLSFICNIAGAIYGSILTQSELRQASLIARETDIAEKKTRDEIESVTIRLSTLIRNLHYGILMEDENRNIALINKSFCDMFGIPVDPELLMGSDCSNSAQQSKSLFVHPEQFVERIDVILREKKPAFDEELELADGRVFERDYIPIFFNEKFLGNLWQYRDISTRKKSETDLRQAIKDAESMNAAKSLFLAKMSHEIRTPLNAVIGLSKLMRDTPLNPVQKNFNDKLVLSGENLLGTINEILDFSKIEAGKIELEALPFSMEDVMKRLYSIHEHAAEEKMISLVARVSPLISPALIGDPARLHQVLTNLVSNAIKFTNTGRVEVTCELVSASSSEAGLLFSVTDTGIGISKENLKHIFENFRQENESVNRIYGGTGLGLAISKPLVNRMGGELQVESHKGKGSRFFFILKFKTTDVKALHKVKKTVFFDAHILDSKKILVAEDNEFNQFIVKSILERWGASVDVAGDGQVAVAQLWLSHYDLVLMDIQMPVMDGLTATRMIRNDLNKKIPIIALTANVTREAVQRSTEAGMNEYISKPFEEEDLYVKVLRAMGKEPRYVIEDDAGKDAAGSSEAKEEMFYDLSKLSRTMGGDNAYIRSMLMKFNEFIPAYYNILLQAYEQKEYSDLHTAAHKIKSSIDLLAGKKTRDLVKQIHDCSVSENDHYLLDELFPRLKEIFPVLISQVQKLIKENPDGKPTGQ